MRREEIFTIVRDALLETAEVNDIPIQGEISEKSDLYRKRFLDSMSLVTLIATVESRLSEMGHNVTIASEKAFSRKRSPFLSVRTLIDFIEELLHE